MGVAFTAGQEMAVYTGDLLHHAYIESDRMNFDSFAVSQRAQLFTSRSRPVQRVAMRALAVNLNAVIAKSFGRRDQSRIRCRP